MAAREAHNLEVMWFESHIRNHKMKVCKNNCLYCSKVHMNSASRMCVYVCIGSGEALGWHIRHPRVRFELPFEVSARAIAALFARSAHDHEFACTRVCVHIIMYAYVNMHMYVCLDVYSCTCICMLNSCMFIQAVTCQGSRPQGCNRP